MVTTTLIKYSRDEISGVGKEIYLIDDTDNYLRFFIEKTTVPTGRTGLTGFANRYNITYTVVDIEIVENVSHE